MMGQWGWNIQGLVFYNIIFILIKLGAFVGLSRNNWLLMYETEDVIKTGEAT